VRAVAVISAVLLFSIAQASAQEQTAMPEVEIRAPPSVSVIALPPSGMAPLRVGFFPRIVDPEAAGIGTVHWTFGDGKVSSSPPPTPVFNTYVVPGTYLVTLNVTTMDGRSGNALTSVVVLRPRLGGRPR
jgi:PKD repeat protein